MCYFYIILIYCLLDFICSIYLINFSIVKMKIFLVDNRFFLGKIFDFLVFGFMQICVFFNEIVGDCKLICLCLMDGINYDYGEQWKKQGQFCIVYECVNGFYRLIKEGYICLYFIERKLLY